MVDGLAIEVKDLKAGYDGSIVVEADLKLDSGLVCFIGPNASGKTTLARSIAGVLKPIGGVVLIDGMDLYSIDHRSRSRIISFLPTGTPRAPLMRVYDIVAMGRSPWRGLTLSRRDLDAIRRAMELTDIEDLSDRFFNELSDGQRQRVLISMALAREPRVLILDEPTSFLDPVNRVRIFELLKRISREILVVVATHDIDLVYRYCDRVYMVKAGRVVELDSWEGVGDLYGGGEYLYIPLVNSFERRLPEGPPRIHLFGGCGSAFLYVRRVRIDKPISVGPVFYGDIDSVVLRRLGAVVYTYDPGMDLGDLKDRLVGLESIIAFRIPDRCIPSEVRVLIDELGDRVVFMDLLAV